MKIELFRWERTPAFTGGHLFVNGLFECHTLEDPIRDVKIPGETAIPEGEYKVIMNMSARFKKRMPLILDVPGFKGVRFHAGNTVNDTEGCVLCGAWRKGETLYTSRIATEQLYKRLEYADGINDQITLKIYDHGVY